MVHQFSDAGTTQVETTDNTVEHGFSKSMLFVHESLIGAVTARLVALYISRLSEKKVVKNAGYD